MLGNILGNVLGAVSGAAGVSQSSPGISGAAPSRADMAIADGDAAYNTAAEVIALITGTAHTSFLVVWERTTPAQTTARWGYGSAALQRNQGYMWFCSLDEAANYDVGVVRLQQSNARGTDVKFCGDFQDVGLHLTTVTNLVTSTPTDINTMKALPERTEIPQVREDSKLQVLYKLTTAATAHDNAGFVIPASVRQ